MPYALALIILGCGPRPISVRRFEFLLCFPVPLEFWAQVETRTTWVSKFRRFQFQTAGRVPPSYPNSAFDNFDNLSRGMADSELDHFGTSEMVDINKCSFRLVSSAFDFKRSAWRLDLGMVSYNFDRC